MKVHTMKLIAPIMMMLVLIGGVTWLFNKLNVETATSQVQYKEKLFNQNTVGQIDITVSEENWQTILDDPTAEQYVEADVSVNGEAYSSVGIRAKGNSSLSSVANSDSERYSLKIDFAQYHDTQTFYGLDTVNLNNNFSDTTQMKEYVAYELMEQMGIATPAHAYVKVYVNGDYYGLLLAVEEVGSAFATTHFGSTEGFIFKPEGNGSDLAYVSDDQADYDFFDEVKMNKQTAANQSTIIEMTKEVSKGDTSSLNIDQLARYFALNTALVNMDSYQGSFKHNYYLYENGDGLFSIIPWDYNMAFGGFNMGGGGLGGNMPTTDEANTETPAVNNEEPANDNARPAIGNAANEQMQPPPMNSNAPSADEDNVANNQANDENTRPAMGGGLMLNDDFITESNIHFSITEPVSGTTVEARPLLQIILQDEEARALYDKYLEEIATTILTEENVLAMTTKLQTLLLDAVEEDPTKFATTEQFIAGVSGEKSLPEFAKQRSKSILKQLAGEIEGISGASSGFGGIGNGQMPNVGAAPNADGQEVNANNRPQMNGEMPDFDNMPNMNGQMPNVGAAPNADGQEVNANNRPQMNGEMPDFDNMPNMNGQMPNFGDRTNPTEATNTLPTLILSVIGLIVIGFALLVMRRLRFKKYKKGLNKPLP